MNVLSIYVQLVRYMQNDQIYFIIYIYICNIADQIQYVLLKYV